MWECWTMYTGSYEQWSVYIKRIIMKVLISGCANIDMKYLVCNSSVSLHAFNGKEASSKGEYMIR